MRKLTMIFIFLTLVLTLTACAGGGVDAPEKATEAYLNALVAADADRMSTLSCAEWESNAMLELDSFQAVEASLKDMTCSKTGEDGETALVTCQGQIVASYNGEDTAIDLNSRVYEMTQSGGEWLVCGYR